MSKQAAQQPPRHWRDLHRRKNEGYLFAEDIGPSGTKVDVEIVESGDGEVTGEDGVTSLPFVAFRGKRKRLGLSRTNCKILESLCGTGDYTKWRGWITLVVVRSEYNDRKTKARLVQDKILVAQTRPRIKSSPNDKFEPPAQDAGATVTEDEAREIARAEALEVTR